VSLRTLWPDNPRTYRAAGTYPAVPAVWYLDVWLFGVSGTPGPRLAIPCQAGLFRFPEVMLAVREDRPQLQTKSPGAYLGN